LKNRSLKDEEHVPYRLGVPKISGKSRQLYCG